MATKLKAQSTEHALQEKISKIKSKLLAVNNWLNSKENAGPEYASKFKERAQLNKDLLTAETELLSLSKF